MAVDGFFESSFGGIRLWCSRVATTNGRKLVIHDPSSGNDHPVQDRGLETRTTSCTLLFDDMEGETETPMERFDRFCEMVERGEPQIFAHPIRGSYLARVGRFDHEVDESSNITAEVEFVPEDRVPPIVLLNASTSAASGEDAVISASDVADAELEALGTSTPVTSEAKVAAEAWQQGDGITVRRVMVDVAQLTQKIGTEIDRLELGGSLANWPAYRAMLLLVDSVLAAGRAATSDVSRLMTVKVGRPIALRTLVAGIYGARDAELRYQQARSLNDIRTPGWLDPGLELRLPQPGVQPRRG